MQGQGDVGLHICQLFLDQLVGRQRPTELLAVQHILASGVPAIFGGTQSTPGNTVAGGVQAGERPLQPSHVREGVFFRHKDAVHHDLASDRGPQPYLAVNGRGTQALPALLQNKAANCAVIVLGPDHEHVSDWAVSDPHLAAGQAVTAVHLAGAGRHVAGIGAMVWFGQPETPNPFSGSEFGQILLAGFLITEFVDGHHHQR